MVNLEAHVLIHALAGQLRSLEQRILSGNPWSISADAPWELAKLPPTS